MKLDGKRLYTEIENAIMDAYPDRTFTLWPDSEEFDGWMDLPDQIKEGFDALAKLLDVETLSK